MSDTSTGALPTARAVAASPSSPAVSPVPASIPSALEFRPNEDGGFDEIVARFADGMVHVETMSGKTCYVGFYWDDGRYCQWYISSKKKLRYYHEDGFTAQGTSAGTAKTEGLGAKPAGPVTEGDAP